ncbi:ComEA family DNA-binding protein [Nocardioides sp. TRM66260-LWL]|uniref:ComEA family DNA-binding protein n=1 Tax=Nocardioides sp. TRM66260-LWL TaxID=2874478 RepID=UPI001CC7C745|nr:ComEA family DNA-binding protein [Nocardioides sp. TRM66260-LWL]MBZ5735881.1 ComEA family DNA-binding protein [Nocardioides sp. TRM66260-LWL]
MRSRAPEPPDDAVARRLELLRAELARAVRGEEQPVLEAAGAAGAARPVRSGAEAPVAEPTGGTDDPGEDWWAGHTRLAPRRLLPGLEGADAALAAAAVDDGAVRASEVADDEWTVPMPGRHASARRGPAARGREAVRDAWQAGPAGRLARGGLLAPGPVAVVAGLVCLGLAWACWSMVRARPVPVSAPIPAAAQQIPAPGPSDPGGGSGARADATPPVASGASAPPAPSAPSGAGAATPAGTVTVDVAGRVRRPGIAVLPAGSRVVDAVEAAGGPRAGVDLSPINLARVLVDGEQIVVGPPPKGAGPAAGAAGAGAPAGSGASGPGASAAGVVNLNTATAQQLEVLPRVGPVMAQAIVAWREQHGGFTAIDELLEVDGIGDATLAQIAPLVTL